MVEFLILSLENHSDLPSSHQLLFTVNLRVSKAQRTAFFKRRRTRLN